VIPIKLLIQTHTITYIIASSPEATHVHVHDFQCCTQKREWPGDKGNSYIASVYTVEIVSI
jgi:hypothetical protein